MIPNAVFCTSLNFLAQAAELLADGTAVGARPLLDEAARYAMMLTPGADRDHLEALIGSRREEVKAAAPTDFEKWRELSLNVADGRWPA